MKSYECPACRRVIKRASTKKWAKSFCASTGRNVRLQRVGR